LTGQSEALDREAIWLQLEMKQLAAPSSAQAMSCIEQYKCRASNHERSFLKAYPEMLESV
jgi:hypothetical protein